MGGRRWGWSILGTGAGCDVKADKGLGEGLGNLTKNTMKELFLFTLIFVAFGDRLFAQEPIPGETRPMKVRLITIDRQIRHGYLYSLTDSSLLLSSEKLFPRPADTLVPRGTLSFGYRRMEQVDIYRKGSIGRSVLVGLGIGAATGALLGLISGDDHSGFFSYTAGEKAAGAGLVGGTLGTLIGLIAGVASHHTFYIGGQQKRYEKMRRRTMDRLGL